MSKRIIYYLLFLSLTSCTTQDICNGDKKTELVAWFKVWDKLNSDTLLAPVSVTGIRAGLPDSLLYDSASASRIRLPLDPNHTETDFVLEIGDQADTIRFFHKNEIYLLSYTCGFANLFTIEEISFTRNKIRDVMIIDPVIDQEEVSNEEHVRIFF